MLGVKPASPAYPGLIVFACAVGMAFGAPIFLIYGFGVFIDPLSEELSVGRGPVSLALSIGLLGNLLAGPAIGALSDRYGARRMTLISVVALAAVLASYSLVRNVYQLYAVSLMLVLLGAGTGPVTFTRIITAWFNERRGLALGITLTGIGIGGAIAPIVSQAFISDYGWRVAYQYLAIIVLLVCFPILLLILRDRPPARERETRGDAAGDNAEKSDEAGLSVKEAIRQPTFWVLIFGFMLVAMGNTGALVHMPPLLTDAGLSPERAALYAGGLGVGVIFGRMLGGYLIDLFHAPYVAIAFLAGPVIAYAFFLSGFDPDLAIIPVILFGIGIGAEFDVIPYLVSRYFGLKNFGVLYGLQISAFSIGSGIGPAVMGFAYDSYGTYKFALIAAMIALLFASLLISRLGRYRFK